MSYLQVEPCVSPSVASSRTSSPSLDPLEDSQDEQEYVNSEMELRCTPDGSTLNSNTMTTTVEAEFFQDPTRTRMDHLHRDLSKDAKKGEASQSTLTLDNERTVAQETLPPSIERVDEESDKLATRISTYTEVRSVDITKNEDGFQDETSTLQEERPRC